MISLSKKEIDFVKSVLRQCVVSVGWDNRLTLEEKWIIAEKANTIIDKLIVEEGRIKDGKGTSKGRKSRRVPREDLS